MAPQPFLPFSLLQCQIRFAYHLSTFETKSKFYNEGDTIRNLLIVASTPFGDFQTVRTIDCNCDNTFTYRILQEDFYPIKTENNDFLNQEH